MLAEYSSITSLVIRGCGLWSGIPVSLYQRKEFTSLHTLDLAGNLLDGPLPAQLEWGATRWAGGWWSGHAGVQRDLFL